MDLARLGGLAAGLAPAARIAAANTAAEALALAGPELAARVAAGARATALAAAEGAAMEIDVLVVDRAGTAVALADASGGQGAGVSGAGPAGCPAGGSDARALRVWRRCARAAAQSSGRVVAKEELLGRRLMKRAQFAPTSRPSRANVVAARASTPAGIARQAGKTGW